MGIEQITLDADCRFVNRLRPVDNPRHDPLWCTPCAESLTELKREDLQDEVYSLKTRDFIPLVGLSLFSGRTDLASDSPVHSFAREISGALILTAYNALLAAGVYYVSQLFQ